MFPHEDRLSAAVRHLNVKNAFYVNAIKLIECWIIRVAIITTRARAQKER